MKLPESALFAFPVILASSVGTCFTAHGVGYLEQSQNFIQDNASETEILKAQASKSRLEAQKIGARIQQVSEGVNKEIETTFLLRENREIITKACSTLGHNIEVVTEGVMGPNKPTCKHQRQALTILEVVRSVCSYAEKLDRVQKVEQAEFDQSEDPKNMEIIQSVMDVVINFSSNKVSCQK